MGDLSGNTACHYAAAYGWYFCLKLLIEAGAYLNKANDWQLTPLAVAYMKGHMGLADLLLEQQDIDINCQDEKGLTLIALTLTSSINKTTRDQLSYLIKDKNADCTLCDSMGNNPLHHLAAAMYYHQPVSGSLRETETTGEVENEEIKVTLEIAKLLIDYQCNVNQLNEHKKTPMITAMETGKMKLAEFFLKNGGILPEQNMPLNGTENVMHFLAKGGKHQTSTQLFSALAENQPAVVKTLLEMNDSEGFTPILMACKSYGATVNGSQKDTGVIRKHIRELIKEMIIFHPACLKQTVTWKGDRPLRCILDGSGDDSSDIDFDEDDVSGKELNATSNDDKFEQSAGQSVIHLILHGDAGQHEEWDDQTVDRSRPLLSIVLEVFFKNRKDLRINNGESILEIVDSNCHTPLMTAVHKGDGAAAVMLIEAGAKVNTVMKTPHKGEQPSRIEIAKAHCKEADNINILMFAVKKRLNSVVKALLSKGTDIAWTDSNGDTALHHAAKDPSSETADIVKMLLSYNASPQARNAKGRTPLHIACNTDTGTADVSTETIELLLHYGAKLHVTDSVGRVPLHYAFVKIEIEKDVSAVDPIAVCQVLLGHMKNDSVKKLRQTDIYGRTPLHYAAMRGANICCMSLLRYKREHLDVQDNEGNTALGLAVFYKHQSCALCLLQENAEIDHSIHKLIGKYESMGEWLQHNKWKWAPVREQKTTLSEISVPTAIVRNEWQGIVFVILDLMESFPEVLFWLTKAAIEYRKYNLVLTLVRICKTKIRVEGFAKSHDDEENLFLVFAKSSCMSKTTGEEQLQLKVAEALLSLGVPFYGNWSILLSQPAIEAAKKHNFTLLTFFENNHPNKQALSPVLFRDSQGHTVFTALLCNTDASAVNTIECRKWLQYIHKNNGLFISNVKATFPKPRDWTDAKGRSGCAAASCSTPEPVIIGTSLIQAVISQNFELCKFLITRINAGINETDGNGMTPLMHAVKINNIDIVYLLLNNDYELRNEKQKKLGEDEEDNAQDQTISGRVFASGAQAPLEIPDDIKDSRGGSIIDDDDDDDDDDVDDYSLQFQGNRRRRKQRQISRKKNKKRKSNRIDKCTFQKTSNVDLNLEDNHQMNVLHHCVNFDEWGGWENVELVKLLLRCGAKPWQKDDKGKTPLDYATESNQRDIALVFQLEMGLTASFYQEQFTFSGCAPLALLNNGMPDINKDAEQFLMLDAEKIKRRMNEAESKERKAKQDVKPHYLSGYQGIGEVVRCQETNQLYRVLLNKVDVKYGLYGFYNFYRLQLIQRKGSNLHIVFTNWGCIGDEGQYQRTPFGNLEDAEKEFRSIFKSKTGNQWSQMPNFVENPKKYKLIYQDPENLEAPNISDLDIDLGSQLKSKLPKSLTTLMEDISNLKAMKDKTMAVHKHYHMLLPFGRLVKETVLNARETLKELQENIIDLLKMKENVHEAENLEKCERIMNRLADLSNKELFKILCHQNLTKYRAP